MKTWQKVLASIGIMFLFFVIAFLLEGWLADSAYTILKYLLLFGLVLTVWAVWTIPWKKGKKNDEADDAAASAG